MNNLDKQYQDLLVDIIENGIHKEDRTGTGTISVFGRQIRHKMSEGFPLLTTKKMYWRGIVTELLWFLRGDTNIKFLVDNNCHIWDGDAYKAYVKYWEPNIEYIEGNAILTQEEFINKIKTDIEFANRWGDLGPIYGKQWRAWKTFRKVTTNTPSKPTDSVDYIDQIANLINELKTNPDSRRLMVSAWNVGELDQMTLPPCHFSFQCYSHEKDGKRYLSLAWNQRSVDVGLGLPFNIASYGLLLEIIAKEVNMIPYEIIGNLGDVHLYLDHIEPIKEQLTREPYPLPKLLCLDEYHYLTDEELVGVIPFTEKIEKFRPDFFTMGNYQSYPTIKLPLSN
jgi:thymidylate synthase